MTYINGLGKNYVEEYKEFGEKVLAESEQTLKKTGILIPIFNTATEDNPEKNYAIEHKDETSGQKNDLIQKGGVVPKKLFEPDTIMQNESVMNVKSPDGILNSMYKKGIKASAMNSKEVSGDVGDAMDSLEEADGNDSLDDVVGFMETKFKDGVHLSGGGYLYNENGEKASTQSVTGNVTGSYKNKKGNFSVLYGGSFEYSKTTQKQSEEDSYSGEDGTNKSGNAIVFGKYTSGNMTYAAGGSAYLYDNNTQLYNIYAATAISKVAVILNRQIQVTADAEGKRITNNQTSVKVNVLKPKEAGDFPNNTPELPTPSEMQQYDSAVESETQEVDDVVNKEGVPTGFGLDLEISTTTDADEYGVVLKHTSLLTKKDDKDKIITLTPYLGLYDYHPNSQEGLKVRVGAEANFDITTSNQVNFKAKAIVDNKRIMHHGSSPKNTFMAVVGGSASKNKFTANVSGGYICSSPDVKYLFVTGGAAYNMKNSSVSLVAGYQSSDVPTFEDKIVHIGARYTVNF